MKNEHLRTDEICNVFVPLWKKFFGVIWSFEACMGLSSASHSVDNYEWSELKWTFSYEGTWRTTLWSIHRVTGNDL